MASIILRNLTKIRYWVLGGLVGGSASIANWYDDWKQSLPQLPEWARYRQYQSLVDKINLDGWKGSISRVGWPEGAPAALDSGQQNNGKNASLLSYVAAKFAASKNEGEEEEKFAEMTEAERVQKLQEDLLKTQLQYQRELELLEKENKNLKQRLLLKDVGELKRQKKIKRSLIDMYSDMLDTLIEYDASYGTADNLPRVVVVGDQSAGKTSVLEMIAQARIFPRGSGEMMTRAPVKVTLSEGPYHVAQFKDSNREFDLTRGADLQQLRNEIELRMRNSVRQGKTVSNDVIALTVKGPSLPRMVLVDLPGVISTVTAEMARETKDDIVRMCKTHMENPNSIILCIQDGSVDAERSNVTDLVTSVDPAGQRTILVLTKVDLAEKNLTNPDRIKKILEGKLFPMRALGYFAVVTGMDNREAGIERIRKYEEEFFESSKLFRDGVLKATQMTTRNMSMAVSDCFWRMVRESIEAQADAFRAQRFNLETEWKNTFAHQRDLTREELFDKARGEVLDEVVNLSLVSAVEWESILRKNLWNAIAAQAFDQILMPASTVENSGSFNTVVDIKLKHWAEKELANKSIQVGWETLSQIFRRQVEHGSSARAAQKAREGGTKSGEVESGGDILAKLKEALVEEVMRQHLWDPKALDYLRVIQLNALADQMVPDRNAWSHACQFMTDAAQERIAELDKTLCEIRGPSSLASWLGWTRPTPEQQLGRALLDELAAILALNPEHKQSLLDDDLTVVRRKLEEKGHVEVNAEHIRTQWRLVYKRHFYARMAQAARDCMWSYPVYKQGVRQDTDLESQAIIFFYRLSRMLELSCNALRQQIVNTEQRRLEREVKDILNDWSADPQKKRQHLTGRQVELAEELAQVRHIQERLEEFIVQLHQEKP